MPGEKIRTRDAEATRARILGAALEDTYLHLREA
jgi:hypothetical protein